MKKLSMFLAVAMLFSMGFSSQQEVAAALNLNTMAVYTSGDAYFEGSAKVEGDALVVNGAVTAGWNNRFITGTVYKSGSTTVLVPSLVSTEYTGDIDLPEVEFTDIPDAKAFKDNTYSNGKKDIEIDYYVDKSYEQPSGFTLSENAYINKLEVKSNLTFNIFAAPGEVRILRVNQLIANGFINVVGGGRVVMYVTAFSDNNGGTINAGGNSENMTIFFTGLKDAKLSISNVVGNVIAPEHISVLNTNLTGNVYAGGTAVISGVGQINGLVYAPASETKLEGSAIIKGQLVTNKLKMYGDTKVIYGPVTGLPSNLESLITIGEPEVSPTPEPTVEPTPEPTPEPPTVTKRELGWMRSSELKDAAYLLPVGGEEWSYQQVFENTPIQYFESTRVQDQAIEMADRGQENVTSEEQQVGFGYVWDGGEYFDVYKKQNGTVNYDWASWKHEGVAGSKDKKGEYTIKRFAAYFEMENLDQVESVLLAPEDELGNMSYLFPINDNLFVFVNGELAYWGGTDVVAGRNKYGALYRSTFMGNEGIKVRSGVNDVFKELYPHTDGWCIDLEQNKDAVNIKSLLRPGFNRIDIITDDYWEGGGMNQLKLFVTSN